MKPYTNTSAMSYNEIIKGMAKMLEPYPWDLWATLTTHYPLKKNIARDKVTRLHKELSKQFVGTIIFFSSEPFDSNYGYHLHSLIGFPRHEHLDNRLKKIAVNNLWQKVTGGGPKNLFNWTDIAYYDKRLGARHYISKYTMRQNTDWDFLGI